MPRWGCHFLIAADNNLYHLVKKRMARFGAADPERVDVVAQLDVPKERAKRYVLNTDGRFRLLPRRRGTRRNLDGGDPQVLINFLIASRRLRPAHSLAVIFSSHGTGITDLTRFGVDRPVTTKGPPSRKAALVAAGRKGAIALGVDDTSQDFLDNNELEYGLKYSYAKYGHRKPEILGCDACLMATVELAHQLRDCGTYLVASQDNESAAGWPYEKVLEVFSNRVKPAQAAADIVRVYGRETDDDMTLSTVDLRLMDELAAGLDRLGNALVPSVKSEMRLLADAREQARTFSNFDSIDLYGYVQALKTAFGGSARDNARRREIRAAADAVLATLRRAVVATSKNPKISGAHGLSVYLPNSLVINAYHDFPLSAAAPGWHRFVVAYGALRHLI